MFFSNSIIIDLGVLVVCTIVCVKLFVQEKLLYWKLKGLVSSDTTFLFGHMLKLIKQEESFTEHIKFHYDYIKSKNQPHGGEYFFLRPMYFPIDPEIIKHIMQVDFNTFMDRGVYFHEGDPLSMNLFFIEGEKWKRLRSKLSPAFTSGKMKMMFDAILDCSKQLTTEMDKNLAEPIELKDILGRFTTDVIGSVAFGIECNSLKNPNCEFREYSQKFFVKSIMENFKSVLTFILPELMDYFKPNVINPKVTKFFMKVVGDTVHYRETNNIKRKDFMHLLLQLKNTGYLEDEEIFQNTTLNKQTKLDPITLNELAAQAFLFFVGGYETSSTTMTFALYQLAKNQDVQEKLRQSIMETLGNRDGKVTYDALKDMQYLDQVMSETLRFYPPLPTLHRVCLKDYPIPNTDFVLEKGTKIHIPVNGLHHDADYFPEPEKFDPERFSDENKHKIKPFTYLPFGTGPRMCIGDRFGKLQTKIGLVVLLRNYKFSLNSKTIEPLQLNPNCFIPSISGGLWMNCQKID